MEDTGGKILMGLGAVLLVIVATIISAMLGGWAISTLWAWFVVPVFAVPQLGIAQAMGISCLVTYMTYHGGSNNKCKNDDESKWEAYFSSIFLAIFSPLMFVFVGWIITFFL